MPPQRFDDEDSDGHSGGHDDAEEKGTRTSDERDARSRQQVSSAAPRSSYASGGGRRDEAVGRGRRTAKAFLRYSDSDEEDSDEDEEMSRPAFKRRGSWASRVCTLETAVERPFGHRYGSADSRSVVLPIRKRMPTRSCSCSIWSLRKRFI